MRQKRLWPLPSPFFIIMLLPLSPPAAHAQLVINEIMYAPLSPEPEWVEIFNASSAPVELDGWQLEDASGSSCRIGNHTLAAGGYLLLTEEIAALRSQRAFGAPVLQVDLPSLNNDADRIVLRDPAGITSDSVRYASSWSTIPRSSLERRSTLSSGTAASSWGSSRDTAGATPGARNSLSPPRINVALDSARYQPAGRLVIASLRNGGTTTAPAGRIVLHRDRNEDGIGSDDEEIARVEIAALAPGKRTTCTLALPDEPPGSRGDGIVTGEIAGDEVDGDNTTAVELPAGSAGGGIVINEIMFDPAPLDEESSAEYIELMNITTAPVEVAGWKIFDRTGKAQAVIPLSRAPIEPGGYLLVASDSTIYRRFGALHDFSNVVTIGKASFSLNLEEEDVTIRDASGRTIDSLTYRSDWHWSELAGTRGISLERLSSSGSSTDRRNWSSSVASLGGTPGARNSRALEIRRSDATLAATPDILSPDGDGREDFTRISWQIPRSATIITVSLYDRHGRLIARIIDNEPAAAHGETIWNGIDGRGERVPPGIYLLMLEAVDGSVVAKTKVIVGG